VTGLRPTLGPAIGALSHGANRLAEWILAVFLAAMTAVAGLQIAGRFVFSYSPFWSDELTRFLLIWVSFLGMSLGVYRGAHPGIDSLLRALPPGPARLGATLGLLLSLLFFAVLVVYGSALAFRTWEQRSVSLEIPMGIPYLAVPASGLLMCLHTVAAWLQSGSARSVEEDTCD
jgi:TRAP-type C4-dicarboxylate transport system permease small subunit